MLAKDPAETKVRWQRARRSPPPPPEAPSAMESARCAAPSQLPDPHSQAGIGQGPPGSSTRRQLYLQGDSRPIETPSRRGSPWPRQGEAERCQPLLLPLPFFCGWCIPILSGCSRLTPALFLSSPSSGSPTQGETRLCLRTAALPGMAGVAMPPADNPPPRSQRAATDKSHSPSLLLG